MLSGPVATPQRSTTFYGSQVGGTVAAELDNHALPHKLLWHDIKMFFQFKAFLPYIMMPLRPTNGKHLDELSWTAANLWAMFLHGILILSQGLFLLSIPLWIICPLWALVIFWIGFYVCNSILCYLLNGSGMMRRQSDPRLIKHLPPHPEECWIFLNGVAVGRHWLQCNVDRLSITFGRPVIGVHNPTAGILFDIIQCLVQRNFSYGTDDVRQCYAVVKENLCSSATKVVFILHSQGGIEGGIILDWLLQELPQDLLSKLEVYTFGNAANHFNNPHKHVKRTHANGHAQTSGTEHKTIRYIEHYANSADFVARWGVLHFTNQKGSSPIVSRYMGRVFEVNARGHQLNQHYLDNMFPLTPSLDRACSTNSFMESLVYPGQPADETLDCRESLAQSFFSVDTARTRTEGVVVRDVDSPVEPATIFWPGSQDGSGRPRESMVSKVRVKHLSRLWLYKNGESPPGDAKVMLTEQAEHERIARSGTI